MFDSFGTNRGLRCPWINRSGFVAALYERRIFSSSAVADRRYNKPVYLGTGGHTERLMRIDRIHDLVESGGEKILGVAGVENFDSMGEQRSSQHGVVGPTKRKIITLH